MKRFIAIGGLFFAAMLQAQVEQLATSGDGHTLLIHTYARLQTETGLGSTGKIYRWHDGQWTRLAVAQDEGFAISPPDVFSPFVSTDGTVFGWQINVGCILCQIIVAPPLSSSVTGVALPPQFPLGTMRMSPNGRYFTADSFPFSGAKYLDLATGDVFDVPVDGNARPVTREVANDGTALLLITETNDPTQLNGPAPLALWKPGSEPRPIYSDNHALGATISATGGRVAFEAVVEGGPNDDQRTLAIVDTQSGELIPIAAMPPLDFRANTDSVSQPVWDTGGAHLIFRTFDDRQQPTAISLWDSGTRQSSVVLNSAEGFASAVISGDGRIIWAATNMYRLLRLDLATGITDEILSPLGSTPRTIDSFGVPGAAILIPGQGHTKAETAVDGSVSFPIVDAVPEGLWVQVPWEYAALPQAVHKILVRSANNPFEAQITMTITPQPTPHIATFVDPASGLRYAKAVHQDFGSLVTPANPARRGEIIHLYLTGLGPLDQNLPTGAPGPFPPARPITPFQCSLVNRDLPPMVMQFVGIAPGLIGIYQADLTIPSDAPEGTPSLFCTTDPNGNANTDSEPLRTTSASK
jgi:uncharacterized protein (TIGR03437 family)